MNSNDAPPPSNAPDPGPAKSAGPPVEWAKMLLIAMTLCIVAAIAYVVGLQQADSPTRKAEDLSLRVLGLANPVNNRLAERYTDTDGDLIADTPLDAGQIVSPETLMFSYIPTDDPERYREAFAPLVQAISEEIGRPVQYVTYPTREAQLRALEAGELHLTGFNTGSVPIAVNACGFVPVITFGRQGEELTYTMQIIVPSDSRINEIGQLRNHTLTLTSPDSNSGFKAALVTLRDSGLTPNTDVQLTVSGGHEASIQGIANGDFEAAAVASDLLARSVSEGIISEGDYKVIYESESFPSAGIGYVYNLDPDLAAEAVDAILDFRWAGTPLAEALGGGDADGFVEVNYKDAWALIRRIDDAIGFRHDLPEEDPVNDADLDAE